MAVARALITPDDTQSLWQNRRTLWTLRTVVLILLSLVIWGGTMRLYAKHNTFPPQYHPDEAGKANQLLTENRNYLHPQLMLEAALLVVKEPAADGASESVVMPRDTAMLVRRARWISAAFGAGTAVCMAWAGYAAAGWAGFLCVGLATALCPSLLAHSHYLKEDAAVAFGVALTACCGAWMIRCRRPGTQVWWVVFLGIAAGVAASGKYAGAVMLLPAVAVAFGSFIARRQIGLAFASVLIVTVFAIATWLAINYRVLSDVDEFLRGFNYEKVHSTDGHQGLTMADRTPYFADLVWREAMPHVKWLPWLAVPAVALLVWRRRQRSVVPIAVGTWIAATGGLYLLMLSYSKIPFFRYALPVTVLLYATAALVLAWVTFLLPQGRWRIAATFAVVGLIAVLQGRRCADHTWQFANDSRDALREWIWTSVPQGTPVAADGYTMLQYAPSESEYDAANVRVPYVVMLNAGPYSGDVASLRQRGVKYAITCSSSSDRFYSPYVVPENDSVKRGIDFYKELLTYPVAWSRVAKHPMRTFANPDIIVYDISRPPVK